MNAENWGHLSALWLLGLVPVLVVAYAFDGQRRQRLLERIGHLPMLREMTASASPARRRWRAVLTVFAVALLCVCLARPQAQGKGRLTENKGLDLVVALDFSKSMLARDVYPSRLQRAKLELSHLVDGLKGDRVGLVAFAGESLSYPITSDYTAAKLFWRDLQPSDMPVGGTDLGRAIQASRELLSHAREADVRRRPDARRRPGQVILLLTDGEDTENRGIQQAAQAAKEGIKIFTLGIGTSDRPYVQIYDDDGKPAGQLSDDSGNPVRVGLDEASLAKIAQLTSGEYVKLDPQRFGIERVQSAIAALERTEEEARFEREPEDIARFFLAPAFLCLVLSSLVRQRKRKVAEQARNQEQSQPKALAAAILILFFPFITGFDMFQRRDPNLEEGNKLLQQGKAAEALEAYDRAAAEMPDEPIVRFDRGSALYALGRYPEAQKEFQRAQDSRDPQLRADAYYNAGNALFKQERWKESLDAYKHTLGLRPDDKRAKWNLELALRRIKEEQEKKQQQQQNQDQKDQKDQQQQQQQQQGGQQKDQQQQQKDQTANESPERGEKPPEKKGEQKKKEAQPVKEIDKQDAEAVLDAFEKVEPTVQKDLAKRRAGNRRPSKDW